VTRSRQCASTYESTGDLFASSGVRPARIVDTRLALTDQDAQGQAQVRVEEVPIARLVAGRDRCQLRRIGASSNASGVSRGSAQECSLADRNGAR
jgi:hypothetical protein